MNFKVKPTKKKVSCVYKTIYIQEELSKKIEKLAYENNSSFNNIVISMIEYCINENNNKPNNNK